MSESDRRSSWTLLAALVVIGLAVLFVTLVPSANCPDCRGEYNVIVTYPGGSIMGMRRCKRCENTGLVTLFSKWFRGHTGKP